MKELNTFRQFLNEDQMKNLAKLLRDEADQPDNKVGKSIFLKYAAQAEKTDVKDIKSLLGKLEDELIDKHPDRFSGDDDIVGSFLSVSKNYTVQENELHEGTWSLGTLDSMKAVMQGLANIRDKADLAMDPNNKGKGFVDGFKMALNNEAFDARMYRVFGDDSFHDHIAAARREANVGNFDGAKNALGDALARGAELFDAQYKYENENLEEGEEVEEGLGDKLMAKFRNKRAAKKEKERFTKGLDMKDFRGKGPVDIEPEFTAGLEENDAVLDEMAQSMGIFKEIDAMIGSIKDQMSPDDAFDSLVSEFEAISGGTKLLHRALKNISLDNNL